MKYQKAIEKLPFTEKGHANAQKQSTTAQNNTFQKKKKMFYAVSILLSTS